MTGFDSKRDAAADKLQEPAQEPVALVIDGVLVKSALPEKYTGHLYTIPPQGIYYTPPQRTERPADCERCNRLEEQAYDLVGKLRVANIKLSMQPQRTWIGLTNEEVHECLNGLPTQTIDVYARRIEAKLKEKNT